MNIYGYVRRYWQGYVICAVALFLFLVPVLFWGRLYLAGGDDGRLYYIFPWEYLKNFAFNVISNNTVGGNSTYSPASFSAPLVFLFFILKSLLPFANTQMIAYGLLLSSAFIFFNAFLNIWVMKKTSFTFFSGILASLAYLFSPYIGKTLLQNQLIPMYILTAVPASLYFFISGIRKRNISYILLSSVIFSLLSSNVYSLPWVLPFILMSVPIFIFVLKKEGSYCWKALCVFIVSTVFFNLYWIIHYIIPLLLPTGEVSFAGSLLTTAVKQHGDDLINALVSLNIPLNQIIGIIRTSWSESVLPAFMQMTGVGILTVILLAGVFLKKSPKSLQWLYVSVSFSVVLCMMFVTPNFGKWNIDLFSFLTAHVPFFSIFKNMYDKFAFATSFFSAFLLFISLTVIGGVIKNRIITFGTISVLFIIICIRAYPFILPAYTQEQRKTQISGSFNTDYIALTGYIRSLNTPTKFLWYPMTYPGYVYISDRNINGHYYLGISPLQFLAKASDIGGFLGISTAAEPELNRKVLLLLKTRSYEELVQLYQKQNIGYIIVSHETIDPGVYDFLNSFNFIALQSEGYKNVLLGRKIKDFGSRYSLYEMNDRWRKPTAYALPIPGLSQSALPGITLEKAKSGDFTVAVTQARMPFELVFMEPFNKLWNIYLVQNNHRKKITVEDNAKYHYGNSWIIDTNALTRQSGSSSFTLQIQFWPIDVTTPAIITSILSVFISLLYAVYRICKKT